MIAVAYGTNVAAASQKGCIYGLWKDVRRRPQAELTKPLSGEAQQDDADRDSRQTDELQVARARRALRGFEHDAKRAQRQIDIVVGLRLEPHRTSEQDVELAQIIHDTAAKLFVWCNADRFLGRSDKLSLKIPWTSSGSQ
ncbi:hypothetical protein R3F73_30515 [Bradyrhizobium japonicum]|uniref:hypothetical protein n=1 Tax=Bradyrhizobium japonicum TaxID=375 RepID=UPI002B4647C5|nr:hypothetical protein [Bradyrhizobium japonicum]WRK43652.1 hypothetical protein R3F73_30515 [Bradyrhizobium japonicum]